MSVIRPATETAWRFPVRRMLAMSPFVAVALGAAVVGARARVPENQIVPGVHVGDLDLGGKTLDEARTALAQWSSQKQATRIALRFDADARITRAWKPDAAKLGLGINVSSTLDAAGKAGRNNFGGQVTQMFGSPAVIQVTPVNTVDDARLRAYLKRQIATDVYRKPKNARFVLLRHGGFGTHHEQPGFALDFDSSATAIKQAWTSYLTGLAATTGSARHQPAGTSPTEPPANSQTAPAEEQPAGTEELEAALTPRVVQPEITSEDLSQINGVLGAKSSYVNGTIARLGNIRIAAKHINGTLLKPGEIFSYNKIVGPRDEDSGYREAPILIRGKHETGVAGGICQTSGTLFNAVLHSGLKIVEREHHSTPIGYLPVGLDATVAYGSLDFKFQNDTDTPVYIAASLNGRELTFTLFGKETPGREIALVRGAYSRTGASYDTQADPSKPKGYRHVVESGSGGCHVTWYRIIRENGHVVHRDVISSHYNAHPGVVVVGTGVPKPRPAKRSSSGASAESRGSTASSEQSDDAPQL